MCLGLGPDVGSAARSARRNGSALLHAQCVGMDEACVVAGLVLLFPLLHSQHALACAYLRKREQERARARERERERERERDADTKTRKTCRTHFIFGHHSSADVLGSRIT